MWLGDDECLDDDVGDALPQGAHVVVVVTQVLVEVAQGAFTARVHRPTLLVSLAVFVHGVVGQVHEQVVLCDTDRTGQSAVCLLFKFIDLSPTGMFS